MAAPSTLQKKSSFMYNTVLPYTVTIANKPIAAADKKYIAAPGEYH